MTPANSEQFAHQAAQHATDAKAALGYLSDAVGRLTIEDRRLVAEIEMQHALVCAVLALRDTIREGHA